MTNLKYLFFGLIVSIQSHAQDFSRIQAEIEHFVPNDFMGSVLIAKEGEPIYSEFFGLSNIEEKEEVSESSIFRIASISKQFTAAAILLLEERGRLSIEDSVTDYVLNLPQNLKQVSIFHLLTHTSGISDGIPNEAFNSDGDKLLELSEDQLAEIELESNPGEIPRYNNAGYHLLGEVIESVSGLSYSEFVSKNILEPLQLQQTGFVSSIPDTLVNGYVLRDGALVMEPVLDSEILGPYSAGGMISTTKDLLTWINSLFNNSILTQPYVDKMTTPFKGGYALGLQIQEENARLRVFHVGALFGAAASVSYYPNDNLSIIVLSNVNGRSGGGDAEVIAKSVEFLMFEDDVMLQSERVEINLPVSILDDYVGEYVLPNGDEFVISIEGEQLAMHLKGDTNSLSFYPASNTTFFTNMPFIRYEFIKDEGDKVTELVVNQRGSTFTFKRETN
ncbi:MAG: serine hydrolase [Pseudohongiella sp.]|nr:serine hydrolase [Pseudohongiella sp.]